MTERFMVDDCGTLIDMQTRDTFDYVSDVCDLLNDLQQEVKDNEHYHSEVLRLYKAVSEENEQLKQFQDTVFVLINEMIETASLYRTPIKSLDYGDDLGYWNGVYQKLKELREILEKRKRS